MSTKAKINVAYFQKPELTEALNEARSFIGCVIGQDHVEDITYHLNPFLKLYLISVYWQGVDMPEWKVAEINDEVSIPAQ
jgi:hypothetical protein